MTLGTQSHILTRDLLLSGAYHRLSERHSTARLWNDAALTASLACFLKSRPQASEPESSEAGDSTGDIWVFGYGSLVWNPAFHFDEQLQGRIHGWHRRFCLWASLGRGNAEKPGLVLGLERGGSCGGMVFRIAGEHARTELSLLWRREMISGSYVPRWVRLRLADGRRVLGITFTIDRQNDHYAGALPDHEVARVLASASGSLGRCADYYFSTLHALESLGIRDRRLDALRAPVMRLCAEQHRNN